MFQVRDFGSFHVLGFGGVDLDLTIVDFDSFLQPTKCEITFGPFMP